MIIDNRYYRIKSIFGYRLRALLVTHWLTATLDFRHKEWLLRLQTLQIFGRSDKLKKKTEQSFKKLKKKGLKKSWKKLKKNWKSWMKLRWRFQILVTFTMGPLRFLRQFVSVRQRTQHVCQWYTFANTEHFWWWRWPFQSTAPSIYLGFQKSNWRTKKKEFHQNSIPEMIG